ncbi:MAG TPA: DEAD/DEAH box helicase [Baekduia sp.]|nr:DEAD/DEAH box helicase [Baekduia sp.]
MTNFADLGLSEATLHALRDVGYTEPSPIQEQAIPVLLEGRDMIGQAQTGSGKTAAFGIPMMEHVDASDGEVQALVLTPTRELCIQVTQALRAYGTHHKIDVVAVFGGAPIRSQQAQLRSGGQVVVGTVGRVKDLIQRRSLMLDSCRYVVLDEADEMLDLGFLEDVEKILGLTPNGRQTALFSATMPPEIRKLADKYLYYPEHVKVENPTLTVDTVEQFSVEVKQADKAEKLVEVLRSERPDQAIVFTRTKIRCDQLLRKLKDQGFNVRALHGDMSQGSRDGVMLAFKGGRVPILVATDVAARGLDISTVTHVVNFDVPTPDSYVHRIGRTGRAGRSGRAVTFIDPKQTKEREAIEKHISHQMTVWSDGVKADSGVNGDAPKVKPKRHTKPPEVVKSNSDAPLRKVFVGAGKADGIEVADVISAITREAGLEGEAIHDVRVLQRFSFFSVPEPEAERVVNAVNGTEIGGQDARVELAKN